VQAHKKRGAAARACPARQNKQQGAGPVSEAQEKIDESRSNAGGEGREPITIKKYANRRLYNTATSSYVTLEYLSEMVKKGEDFVVYDAKTGEDITRSVLTQIIFDEENKGANLLPVQFLRRLIKFYGDSMQMFVPSYLEMSMETFSRNQEKFREQMRGAFGSAPGFQMFEEAARKNMALFEDAMKMFAPMANMANVFRPGAAGPAPAAPASEDIGELKSQLAALQRQLDKLEKKG
jgi:polyhydroxyalkanoate synthesis repressor PhaR